MNSDPFTVLVVCTGNLNRSALGAALLRTWARMVSATLTLAGHVRVISAGLGAPVGSSMRIRTRVIAESLGADGARSIARPRSRKMRSRSGGPRPRRIARAGRQGARARPAALRSTFTIREAGRIAEVLGRAPAPSSIEELRARVRELTAHRGPTAAGRGTDDIVDPQGKDEDAYVLMARQEVPALAQLATVLFGMPPGEVAAYEAAVEAAAYEFDGTGDRCRIRGPRAATRTARGVTPTREGPPGTTSVRRPMRIVHLDHTSVVGGAEFALLRMLRAHPTWSPYVLVAPASGRGLGIYDGVPPAIPLKVVGVRQPAGASTGRFGAAMGVGVRVAAQAIVVRCTRAFRGADLVDANTARAAAYGALAVRWRRKPFVVHLRDLVEPDALGPAGHSLMVRWVLPRADGVIANSHATLDSALEYVRPGVPAEVIPSASGLRRGDSTGLPAGDGPVRTIGMLARIDPWKGQLVLLEAFAGVFRGRDVRLQFAGEALFGHEDHLAELQERAAELGVADQVDFLGHVNDVDALIAHWDLAVQASTRPEPLGQNVLQYLAAGRAVIAVDEGGPAEWITDGVNGLLVRPRDVVTLAAALSRLDTDAALRVSARGGGSRDAGTPRRRGRDARSRGVLRARAALRRRPTPARDGCDGAGLTASAQPCSPCGGSAATSGWSKLSAPTFAAPPGEPMSSKNSTLAL